MKQTTITNFKFNNNELSAITDESGNPWFIANDVCTALQITNTSQAVGRLDDDEKLLSTIHIAGQNRDILCVNESGLYSLTLTSRKPEAKAFKKWITSEVLPAIRKTGTYSQNQASTDMPEILKAIAVMQEQNRQAIERIEAQRLDDAISLDKSKDYSTVNRVRRMFPLRKFSGSLLTRASDELNIPVQVVHDVHNQGVQAYHKNAWIKAYAINI